MDISNYSDPIANWISQIEEKQNTDPELTIKFCNDLIEYATPIQDATLLGYAYFYSGLMFYLLNDGKHFYGAINMAIRFLDESADWTLLSKSYNLLGIITANSGNIPLALDYYTSAYRYATFTGDAKNEGLILANLGTLYYQASRYQEAQRTYRKAMDYIEGVSVEDGYHLYAATLECNRIKVLIALGYLEQAHEAMKNFETQHWHYLDPIGKNVAYCIQAMLYNEIGLTAERSKSIANVNDGITADMAILECFDDYYDYARMLLSADLTDDLWKVIDTIEPLVKDAESTGLLLKIVSLKIQYYQKTKKSAEYLQATGLYYKLSEIMQKEQLSTINRVIDLRQSLEAANEERREVEKENKILVEKSERDPLTRIANRYRLNDYSEELFAEAFSKQEPLAVAIMDIDYFKEFNDNYGHQAGDETLISVSDVLREIATAHQGFCARYGGDEFVLLFPNTTLEEAGKYALELKERVLERNIPHAYSKCLSQVSLSQGWCCSTPNKLNRMWDFLHAADENLYEIKQVSRNNYCVSDLRGEKKITGGK